MRATCAGRPFCYLRRPYPPQLWQFPLPLHLRHTLSLALVISSPEPPHISHTPVPWQVEQGSLLFVWFFFTVHCHFQERILDLAVDFGRLIKAVDGGLDDFALIHAGDPADGVELSAGKD